MEWVEITGKTVEEAKDLALDQLGVDEADAEFEVLEEPKSGLFGRVRGEARIRARIQPKAPRPKNDRRNRNRSRSKSDGGDTGKPARQDGAGASGQQSNQRRQAGNKTRSDRNDGDSGNGGNRQAPKKETRTPMNAEEQCSAATEFLTGLVRSFGLDATVTAELDADDFLNVAVNGEGLGLLIGPGLNTLDALQELTRNAVQRQADGRDYGRVVVDVDGVRARRRGALESFVADAAAQVVESGTTVVFEVMSSADRKVVHDKVGDIDGVASGSEGEDPRRRVVLKPA
ncbi:MAG: RNA-binding cell elongation regulator Jag/EloR [Actinomycetes bacterium]